VRTPLGDTAPMEIGIYTFGELAPDPATGRTGPERRLRDPVEEVVLADQVGLDSAPEEVR